MPEQLTPEDLERIARIEAETAAEARRENAGLILALGYYAVPLGLCLVLLFVSPLLGIWFGTAFFKAFWKWLPLVLGELVLIALAAILWRGGRIALPDGRELAGWKLRLAVVLVAVAPVAWVLLKGPFWALLTANPFLAELLDGY